MIMISLEISVFTETKISNTGRFNEYSRNFAKYYDTITQCLSEFDRNTGGPNLAARRAICIPRAKVARSSPRVRIADTDSQSHCVSPIDRPRRSRDFGARKVHCAARG
jgi:hypothetical protein